MNTTTVLRDDTATIVQDEISRFSGGAVFAGAVIATAVTFFLISLGSGLGLALTSAPVGKTFLTLGAIYFVAAEAFGFAVGGHVTGRLMPLMAEESEEENFRADAHGLAVWALAVVFGLALVALAAFATASAAVSQASAPAAYWADKLLTPAPVQGSAIPNPLLGTLADAKAEAARLLPVDAATGDGANDTELARLAMTFAGLAPDVALRRVHDTENAMRTQAKQTADAARKGASYLSLWTAFALLFGAVVCVVATVSARWKEEHDLFGRRRVAS